MDINMRRYLDEMGTEKKTRKKTLLRSWLIYNHIFMRRHEQLLLDAAKREELRYSLKVLRWFLLLPVCLHTWLCYGDEKNDDAHMFVKLCHGQLSWRDKVRFRLITGYKFVKGG